MKTLFVLLLVVFVEGEPVGGKVGGPFDSLKDCEAARKESTAKAKEADVDVVLKCVEIQYKAKPVFKRQRDA